MNATYRFGAYLYEGSAHQLFRDGTVVTLAPKQLLLLRLFLMRAGEVVTKEAVLEAVWPSTRVTDDAITQVISLLREALGDDPSAPTLIETVARRGYRFIAPVIRLAAPPAPPRGQAHDADAATEPGRRPRHGERIAVLDFLNTSNEPELDWLPAAVARTLTSGLRALPGFRIVDRQQVAEAVERSGTSPEAVARSVRADFVIVGAFQRSRTRLRLSGRLLAMADGDALVEARVEGANDELFALLDQMLNVIAHGLGMRPPRPGGMTTALHETQSIDAYRAAADGWRHLEARQIEQVGAAAEAFERALASDPSYAVAHAGLAHARLAWFEASRADNQPAVEALESAVQHARNAVALDEGLAEAHATLGVALSGRGDWEEAIAQTERAAAIEPGNWRHQVRLGHVSWGSRRITAAARALVLHPGCIRAHVQQATVHVARGEVSAAQRVLEEALHAGASGPGHRAPGPGLDWLLGLIHLAQGHGVSATAAFERELALVDPHRPFGREYAMQAHLAYGLVLLTSRRAFDALSEFGAALALYPDHGASNLATAAALVGLGDRSRAASHLASADEAIEVLERYRPLEARMVRAQRLAVTGQADAALEGLQQLLREAPPGSTGWTIPIDPLLGAVRTRPGYAALLEALAKRAE